MNLYAKLREREAQNKLLRVALIGAGKFGAMYLAQVPKTPGIHLAGIADLSPVSARANLERVGWPAERHSAPSLDAALGAGTTHVGGIGRRWWPIPLSTSLSRQPGTPWRQSSTRWPRSATGSMW